MPSIQYKKDRKAVVRSVLEGVGAVLKKRGQKYRRQLLSSVLGYQTELLGEMMTVGHYIEPNQLIWAELINVYVDVPAENMPPLSVAVNVVNNNLRYGKFSVDSNGDGITYLCSTLIHDAECSPQLFETMDQATTIIMKHYGESLVRLARGEMTLMELYNQLKPDQ